MDTWIRPYVQQKSEPKKATHFHLPTKSYLSVPIDTQPSFWLTYCQAVENGRNPMLCEHIGSRETTQLGFDINITFDRQQVPLDEGVIDDLTDSIEKYVKYIIETTQYLLGNYFELSEKGVEILAAYLRRGDDDDIIVWKTNTIEFSARIIFPYARIKTEYVQKFYYFLLHQLQVDGETISDRLAIAPLNGLDTLISPLPTNNLPMYGSDENPDSLGLKLISLYGRLDGDVEYVYEISKIFVPTLHVVVSSGIMPIHMIETEANNHGVEFWLPLFFSNGFYDKVMPLREGVILFESEAPPITISVIRDGGEALTKLDLCRRLLSYLDTGRARTYWSWYDIGDALHTVDPNDDGLKLWKWFTSQADFKTERDCDAVWYTFGDTKNVDMATLEYFASIDSPQNYQALREHQIEDALVKALRMPEHTQIARAFKACYPHNFVCSNFKEGSWYYYTNHRWVSQSGTSVLMRYINEVFQPFLETRAGELSIKKGKSRDPKARADYENDISMYNALILKLSKNGFKKGLCDELKTYYDNPAFFQLRDMGKDLMGCPNGVMDFRGGKPIFRPGKPQDYITKSARCNFPVNFTWESQPVVDLLKYYSQLFKSETMQRCLRRLIASLMISGNNDKIFPMLTGGGNNSKSAFIRLIEKAFGSYCGKLKTSFVTGKQGKADEATPALLSARGCKIVVMEEPNKDEKINSGTAKGVTGGDTQYVRELFQKGGDIVEMEVTFVLFMVANKLPVIPDCQEAIWDRTRVFEFKGVWSKDAPDDEAEQFRLGIFKRDRFFDNKFATLAPALLWVGFHDYEDYYENGLNEPDEVLAATDKFRSNNNVYIHFTKDCVSQVIDENGIQDQTAFVTLADLYRAFSRWHKDEQQIRGKTPSRQEFKEDLEMVWKEKADDEDKWYGIQLNTQSTTVASLLTPL